MLTLYQTAEPGNGWIVPAMALLLIVSSLVAGHALHSVIDMICYGDSRIERMVQAIPADAGAWAGLGFGIIAVLA